MSPLSVEQWAERAQYDLDTAEYLLAGGRYLYVLFCCQQALEKQFKSLILLKSGNEPPFVHNLIRLAELASIELDQEQEEALQALSLFYTKSRYEEDLKRLSRAANAEYTTRLLEKTKEMCQWLSSQRNC